MMPIRRSQNGLSGIVCFPLFDREWGSSYKQGVIASDSKVYFKIASFFLRDFFSLFGEKIKNKQ